MWFAVPRYHTWWHIEWNDWHHASRQIPAHFQSAGPSDALHFQLSPHLFDPQDGAYSKFALPRIASNHSQPRMYFVKDFATRSGQFSIQFGSLSVLLAQNCIMVVANILFSYSFDGSHQILYHVRICTCLRICNWLQTCRGFSTNNRIENKSKEQTDNQNYQKILSNLLYSLYTRSVECFEYLNKESE